MGRGMHKIVHPLDIVEDVWVEVCCALCGKNMDTLESFESNEHREPVYCHACVRAVRIAKMAAAGTLPDL